VAPARENVPYIGPHYVSILPAGKGSGLYGHHAGTLYFKAFCICGWSTDHFPKVEAQAMAYDHFLTHREA
jgi:hypothetical protein